MAIDPGSEVLRPVEVARHRWVLASVLAACWVPLLVAAAVLAQRGWTPVGEFAQAELRVRDFWSHPPSLGAVGRLRTDTDVSSHPGPAAWWAMYPLYAVGGRSAVALSTAVAAVAGSWITAALVVAWRRGGDVFSLLVGLGVLALMAGFGPAVFLEPWNPWFAVMAFVALMMAVWAVTLGGRWNLVVVGAASTFCVQAHLGFAPLCGLLVLVALVGLWHSGPRTDGDWKPLLWPVTVAAGVTAVLWLPPLYEQLTGDPGNLGIIVSAYRAESGVQGDLGLPGAVELVGSHLDPRVPWLLLADSTPTTRGVSIGSIITLIAWAMSAFLAASRSAVPNIRMALCLHVVVAVSLLGAVFAAARIPGEVFGYLVLWLAVVVVLLWVAILFTAWLLLWAHLQVADRTRSGTEQPVRWARIGLVATLALASLGTVWTFSDPEPPGGHLSETASELVEQLEGQLAPAAGSTASYVVRWEDPANFGALGTAVFSELERHGVAVGVDDRLSTEMRTHRVLEGDDIDAALWVVSGDGIEQWRALEAAEEIAFVDPRTPSERAEQARIEAEITRRLDDLGATELSEELPRNAWTVRSAPQVGAEIDALIDEYIELGFPTAVYLSPADTAQPLPD